MYAYHFSILINSVRVLFSRIGIYRRYRAIKLASLVKQALIDIVGRTSYVYNKLDNCCRLIYDEYYSIKK